MPNWKCQTCLEPTDKKGESKTQKRHLSVSPMCLRAAFTRADPKSTKKDSQVKQLFALSGPASVKAARKHIDEIDTCFTHICVKISYKILIGALRHIFDKHYYNGQKCSVQSSVQKLLLKCW